MQQPLHIGTLLIPGGEPVNGECVTQVMNPRLLACIRPAQPCAITQDSEPHFEDHRTDGATSLDCEKGGVGWPSLRPGAVVLNQDPVQLWSDGNQSRLAELRVPNREDRPA